MNVGVRIGLLIALVAEVSERCLRSGISVGLTVIERRILECHVAVMGRREVT